MRVLLIRHAEPDPPSPPQLEDPRLSEAGRAQAACLARAMRETRLDCVVSSTMRRAVETAEPLARALDIPLVTEPALVEIAMGDLAAWGPAEQERWSGITANWHRGQLEARCPGGESLSDVTRRVAPVISRLVHAQWDCGFALLAHAVVNGVILSMLSPSLRPALGTDLGHRHTGIWELEGSGLEFRVVRRDDTSHLSP